MSATPAPSASRQSAHLIAPKIPHLLYGGDYNPEQWDAAVWREDARLMREAGVNLVTVGVFSWALLEPRPGEYDFGWLDRVCDLLHEHGVFVDLATASASPPPWLARAHPETLPQTREGVTLWPGSRQAYCPSSPIYRATAQALARALAERYKNHPALAMWHIGNEYGCHVAECYCDVSAAAFRRWLKDRYTTLDALNDAWGTTFWSQRYGEWEEISPPRAAPTMVNPTQQLDFARFSNDELLACYLGEHALLREVTPDIPITTNFPNLIQPVNYAQWATHEDVVALDTYPDPFDPSAPAQQAFLCDLMRGSKPEAAWMVMEQTPSAVNWRPRNALKQPGQMRLWSYQTIARGAEGTLFFQWRAAQSGAEKFHSAFVGHGAVGDSRVWQEMKTLGNEYPRLDALLGSRTHAEVALIFDWENWWALELASHPSSDLRLLDQVRAYYAPLFARNIAVDVVPPAADLSRYRVALVPNLYLVTDATAASLERFVADGGSLVMSFFSGIVDERDHIRLGGYPAPFRALLGLRVAEFAPYAEGQRNTIRTMEGKMVGCEFWSDVIALEGAEALATYTDDFYAGSPAITRHTFGQGVSYYVGTRPDATYFAELLAQVCREANVHPPLDAPAGVEVTRRSGENGNFLFALNHNAAEVHLTLPQPLRNLLTDDGAASSAVTLPAYGVAILAEG